MEGGNGGSGEASTHRRACVVVVSEYVGEFVCGVLLGTARQKDPVYGLFEVFGGIEDRCTKR